MTDPPDVEKSSPPDRVVLLHGAGSGPWVFEGWREELASFDVVIPDLHEGLDVASATMSDYAGAAMAAASASAADAFLCGWSMGGLAALMAAESGYPAGVVVLEPSPPAEVQGFAETAGPIAGTFHPEEVYGPFPPSIRARPESERARAERKAGVSVRAVPCPLLVISGDEFRVSRGEAVAAFYGGRHRHLPGLTHWDLVTSPDPRRITRDFLLALKARPTGI